jgi:hypothetical protein
VPRAFSSRGSAARSSACHELAFVNLRKGSFDYVPRSFLLITPSRAVLMQALTSMMLRAGIPIGSPS